MRNLIPFIPQELVVFMFVGAGLAMIVGARRIASGLLVTALAVIFMPVLLAPLFDALPGWLLLCVIVVRFEPPSWLVRGRHREELDRSHGRHPGC